MSLTLQRKDELIQQHHHAYSEWNVDLYGLIASIEAESVKEINDNQEYMKSQQTVISELQTERDALAITVKQMREALESLTHVEYALDLPLLQLRAIEALTLPDTSEIIKRHDAAVLRKAAEHLHAKARAYLNEFDRRVAHDMASALEKS